MIQINREKRILEKAIRDNCTTVTLTPEEMIKCLDSRAGLDHWSCSALIERKIHEAHELAVRRTFQIPDPLDRKPSESEGSYINRLLNALRDKMDA